MIEKTRGTGSGFKWDFKINDMIKADSLEIIKKEFINTFVGKVQELEKLK